MTLGPRLACAVAMLVGLASAVPPVAAAVVFEFSITQSAPLNTGGPWGVAVDELGDIYVTDTGKHRIVKFDSVGNPIKAWGSEGSLPGQFYYPLAVATNSLPTPGNIRVYVADDGNHRIVTYDSEGKFLSTFGSEGSGNNQLNHPRGIAVLPFLTGGTQEICVADTGNDRISCFNEQGQWLKSFDCSDCPNGKFVEPQGVAVRRLSNGGVRYYATDNYPARIVMLSETGRHLRTIGGPDANVQLLFPDDLAVSNKDGSIYVADSGIGFESIVKFDAEGKYEFDFGEWGNQHLTQPHAIALDSEGDLVVGHFAEPPVHKFRIMAPRIKADLEAGLQTWIENKTAYLSVYYNGIEQTCNVNFALTINADGRPWTIRTALSEIAVFNTRKSISLDLSAAQANRLKEASQAGLKIRMVTEATAHCESDGSQFVSRSRATIR